MNKLYNFIITPPISRQLTCHVIALFNQDGNGRSSTGVEGMFEGRQLQSPLKFLRFPLCLQLLGGYLVA